MSSASVAHTGATPAQDATRLERAMFEVKRIIVGQDQMVERIFVALLARGHCLLEGVPGVAKTLAVQTVATVIGGSFARIQFTPDLMPADLVGTRIYRQGSETFDVELGPVFVNFLLADEINRAPAKVQSALLEVMAERQVSLGGRTYPLPSPFLVMATQNPIETEGTYPLPEAQMDRFMFHVKVGHPSREEERAILDRMGDGPAPRAQKVVEPARILRAREVVERIYVDPKVKDYVVSLVFASREPARAGLSEFEGAIACGASPRASLFLLRAAKAHAFLRHRGYVTPEDVKAVGMDVLRHRILLTFEAEAEQITAEDVVQRIFDRVEVP